MDRSNDTWNEQLRGSGAERDSALTDLRSFLVCGLRKAIQAADAVDDAFLEDIAQMTLVKVLDKLDQFEGRSRFTTWSLSIAIRLALTELRRRHWKDVSLDQVIDGHARTPEPVADSDPPPEQAIERTALIEKMYQIINQDLTEKQRNALLAEIAGMPQEEIGRRMGSNRNAVYKLTHDARKRLKAGLETSGYTATDIYTAFGW